MVSRLGIGVVKLLNMHHDDSKSSSIEELELLIDQVWKCGGINAAINKLSQPTQDEKEGHGGISKERAVAVDETNKSNSNNDKIEKEELPLIVSATEQDNHDDDHPVETQFRSMVKKPTAQILPPEPPSMRALLASNGNTSNNSKRDNRSPPKKYSL